MINAYIYQRVILIALSGLLLGGCLNGSPKIHERGTLEGLGSDNVAYISIDAKQRLMVAGQHPNKEDPPNAGFPVFCNEPSPDMFSVLSSTLSGNLSDGERDLIKLALSKVESGSSIGIRSQSIQLLRDAMYRICEAYLNKGIGEKQYENLLSKYQKSMVTLIAIEQLTDMLKPRPIIFSPTTQRKEDHVTRAEYKVDIQSSNSEIDKDTVKIISDSVSEMVETVFKDDIIQRCLSKIGAKEQRESLPTVPSHQPASADSKESTIELNRCYQLVRLFNPGG